MPAVGDAVDRTVAVGAVGQYRGAVDAVGWTAVAAARDDLPGGSSGFIEELDPLLLVFALGDVEAVAPGKDDSRRLLGCCCCAACCRRLRCCFDPPLDLGTLVEKVLTYIRVGEGRVRPEGERAHRAQC